MKNALKILSALLMLSITISCKQEDDMVDAGVIQLTAAEFGGVVLSVDNPATNLPVNGNSVMKFSTAIDTITAKTSISIFNQTGQTAVPVKFAFTNDLTQIELDPLSDLDFTTTYSLVITNDLRGVQKETFTGVTYTFNTENGQLKIIQITLNGQPFNTNQTLQNVNYENISIAVTFSEAIPGENLNQFFSLIPYIQTNINLSADQKTVTVSNQNKLDYYTKYTFYISNQLVSLDELTFAGFSNQFMTGLDPSYKFPLISDEELLDKVQLHTFRYFYDYGHPVSGLTRERKGSGETVTIGGSGFGLMALLVGIKRNFITRTEGIERLNAIVDFLTTADRFHGAWPHWMNGSTGKTIPFGTKDDGADLVETSFMAAGLLTVRQYLDENVAFEADLKLKINALLNTIEWSWFTRGGQNVLYWHWSPNYDWQMNMQVRGYNEALITYFMAATSVDFPIEASVYTNGWANNGSIINGKSFYGIPLPVGYDYGGPLFFAHYSFLGLNPTNLSDNYGNYWMQNMNHSLINRQHCIVNPFNHVGYSEDCWGLTASDDPAGYKVHEPVSGRDNGTITPTAALSSMPFTPEESMTAMRHFYFVLGDKLWGEYGFYDAFNPGQGWWANSYLAIDQGPIIVMIENYRSGLCWDLFMSAPETQAAMMKLGFAN
ncbi:MAG: Ig-like domain-containing protein [Bacteroidales bacterium]|nr:Ig-like domain-containing protein [Bacteroidales bacterium]